MTKESVFITKELNSHRIGFTNMTKESVYITKELHSHRIGLVHKHDKRKCLHNKRVELSQDWFGSPTWRRFIILEHQYGCHDVIILSMRLKLLA